MYYSTKDASTRQDEKNFAPSLVHDNSSNCSEEHLCGRNNNSGHIAALWQTIKNITVCVYSSMKALH